MDARSETGEDGFTLIELSIVLVIIGLLVGGVMVGKDLIDAAAVRAQVTQIERYNTAVNTFRNKYGYLPGDVPDPAASSFGFQPRGTLPGQGNGNGIIAGMENGYEVGWSAAGEPTLFWEDLSIAGLIPELFTAARYYNATFASQPPAGYFPQAKLGSGLYVYVMSGYSTEPATPMVPTYPSDYFVISQVTSLFVGPYNSEMTTNMGMTALQAYAIDTKMDDGLPITGTVTAAATSSTWGYYYAGYGSVANGPPLNNWSIPATSTSCFDTNNGAAGIIRYSIAYQGGTLPNCAISVRFQ